MEAGWDKEDPHCFGYMENLIFVMVIGMFMKRSTVPTRVVQYSLGYTIILVPGCMAWTVGFPTVSARYPNPSLGLALQDGYCRPQTTMAPELYGCYTNIGAVPIFMNLLILCRWVYCPIVWIWLHVSGWKTQWKTWWKKNTQYGDTNPYPPSGTLVAQPLDPRRVNPLR